MNSELSDQALLEQVREGKHPAFAALVRRHSQRFYRVAYRFMGERAQAEDIVQEAFIKLWENPASWNPNANARFTTWFYRVVVNLCLDAKKKYTPMQLAEDFDAQDARENQEEALAENERQALMRRAIDALPERQRTALTLCFLEDLSNQEAASVMGIHLKALQSLLIRAKQNVGERLRNYREVA